MKIEIWQVGEFSDAENEVEPMAMEKTDAKMKTMTIGILMDKTNQNESELGDIPAEGL